MTADRCPICGAEPHAERLLAEARAEIGRLQAVLSDDMAATRAEAVSFAEECAIAELRGEVARLKAVARVAKGE